MAASFGKYQLVEKLATGGMGEVFLARAEGSEKLLVLKRILPHLAQNKEFLDLFLDEARIAARLNHANVAQILELGDVDGAWYLLMEYVPGKDLRQVSQAVRHKRRQLPLGLACRIVADAAAGLDCAHRTKDAQGRPMQIVHSDVSPHNVLVSFDGAVKLIDFGVARAVGRLQQPDSGMLRGKYPYMSPEQVSAGGLDHRSDQFSLGVVLWELLAGSRLFKGNSDAVTLQKVAECVVEAPSRKEEAIPRGLIEIVMRALSKDPGQRFADMAALHLELEELITAEQWPASNAELGTFIQALFSEGADGTSEPGKDSARTRLVEKATATPDSTGAHHAVAPLRELAQLPQADASTARHELAELPQAEGVLLFLERARTARPGWSPTDVEITSIEALTHQLAGMPLAIELAAARLATHTPDQLVQQLPRADGSARDATLRRAIAWSWDLLQGHEQRALAQLSIFPGGFTLEQAEAVISLASFPNAPWALDVVQALRDASLVRSWEAADFPGELRFGCFESIGEYALEKLKALGPDAEQEARARYAASLR